MITLHVNGQSHDFHGNPAMTLLLYLRNELNLKSIRPGCQMGNCKLCMVTVDGARHMACSISMAELDSKTVVTAAEW